MTLFTTLLVLIAERLFKLGEHWQLDHRLEVAVAEHDRAEHHLFGELLGFGFDHQHGVAGAGDDEIEAAPGQHRHHLFPRQALGA